MSRSVIFTIINGNKYNRYALFDLLFISFVTVSYCTFAL